MVRKVVKEAPAMKIKETVNVIQEDKGNANGVRYDDERKHYSMPVKKIGMIAGGFLEDISLMDDEDDTEARDALNRLIDDMCSYNDCSGDADDFHNFAVELARADEYRLSCMVLDCGLKRFPKNVDLLADYLHYGINCGLEKETQKAYLALKKIPMKKYTWRGFAFMVDYLQYLIDMTDSDENISKYESEIFKIIEEFKKAKPYSEEPYRAEADVYESLNMGDKAVEVLETALESIEVCPKCALKYADIMLETGDYKKALLATEKGKKYSNQPQASVSEGYIYFLSGLCVIALVSKEDRPFTEEEVEGIYSDFNLSLKEFKSNRSYVSVIKTKTNILVGKTNIAVDENRFRELADLIEVW